MLHGPSRPDIDDRLRVQHEAVVVERVPDALDPQKIAALAGGVPVLPLARRDVTDDEDEAADAVLGLERGHHEPGGKEAPVAADEDVIVDLGRTSLELRDDERAGRGIPGRAVGAGVMEDLMRVLPVEVLRRPAEERLRAWVQEDDPAVLVQGAQPVAHAVGDCAEVVRRGPERGVAGASPRPLPDRTRRGRPAFGDPPGTPRMVRYPSAHPPSVPSLLDPAVLRVIGTWAVTLRRRILGRVRPVAFAP